MKCIKHKEEEKIIRVKNEIAHAVTGPNGKWTYSSKGAWKRLGRKKNG